MTRLGLAKTLAREPTPGLAAGPVKVYQTRAAPEPAAELASGRADAYWPRRNTTSGSTLAARPAGTTQARSAAPARSAAVPRNASGSAGPT